MNRYKRLPRSIALLFSLAVSAGWHSNASAETACESLRSPESMAVLASFPEAPSVLLSAKETTAERDLPKICRVEGIIASSVGFLLRMPIDTWNGKFMMGGCGGSCGNYLVDRIDPALVRNYAVVNTDMGRKGSDSEHRGIGWIFTHNSIQSEIDFGYRATHITAVVAKHLINQYYGKPPAVNYFWGCSTGGRQGIIEAQRFPNDFDGIVVGAPAGFATGSGFAAGGTGFAAWNVAANTDVSGAAILRPGKLKLVKEAVMESCDSIDGFTDGILQDPRQCTWDPRELQCRDDGISSECLTAEEADVVRKIYAGPPSGIDGPFPTFGMPRGSEDRWSPNFIAPEGLKRPLIFSSTDHRPPHIPIVGVSEPNNPDLRRYKAAGSKLIMYHGWNDNNIPISGSIDYYEAAMRTTGGESETKDFFRFFAMPGVNHCRYGDGGGEVDWITYIENWVEKDQAPAEVLAHHMVQEPYPILPGVVAETESGKYQQMARHPLSKEAFDRQRPIYPYPDVAMYTGSGDPTLPSNWKKRTR